MQVLRGTVLCNNFLRRLFLPSQSQKIGRIVAGEERRRPILVLGAVRNAHSRILCDGLLFERNLISQGHDIDKASVRPDDDSELDRYAGPARLGNDTPVHKLCP